MKTWILAGALSLGLAGAVQAQVFAHTLPNGQTLTLPNTVAHCDAPVRLNGQSTVGADLTCRVGATTGAARTVRATGAIVAVLQAGRVTPRQFLIFSTEEWWPDLTPEQRGAQIRTHTKTLASGPARFLCVHRDDVPALAGDALCTLDAPLLQFMVAGRSTMASTADDAVDTILASTTLR